jgi:hypothetical protein
LDLALKQNDLQVRVRVAGELFQLLYLFQRLFVFKFASSHIKRHAFLGLNFGTNMDLTATRVK